ncbi:hypothetical protein [Sulfitobacter aestuariivivens]|uniref:hypothetical protein n=1 Tax=Sulfitobacter aestuariivivens TaxID=2766981 RepID=UPI00360E57AC
MSANDVTSPDKSRSVTAADNLESDRALVVIVLYAAAILVAGQTFSALNRGINWDEFHHYDLVTQLIDGTLRYSLQSLFTQIFRWMPNLPGDVIDHIRVARLVMLLCQVGTAAAIFGVARKFCAPKAAALIALAYLSGGYVVLHGGSFRYDPLAAFLLMSTMWFVACRPLTAATILLTGTLAALAMMITIKSVFYAPAFAGIIWLRVQEAEHKGPIAIRIASCFVVFFAAFCLIFYWHSGYVASSAVQAGIGTVKSASGIVFSQGFLPMARALKFQLAMAPHITALVVLTAWKWSSLKASASQKSQCWRF